MKQWSALMKIPMLNRSKSEGESLEDIKAKLKPKKAAISPEMLTTANTYDDKVAGDDQDDCWRRGRTCVQRLQNNDPK